MIGPHASPLNSGGDRPCSYVPDLPGNTYAGIGWSVSSARSGAAAKPLHCCFAAVILFGRLIHRASPGV
jgi:hypothetical protein